MSNHRLVELAQITSTVGSSGNIQLRLWIPEAEWHWIIEGFSDHLFLSFHQWPTKLTLEFADLRQQGKKWVGQLSDVNTVEDAAYFIKHAVSLHHELYRQCDWHAWSLRQKLVFAKGCRIFGTELRFLWVFERNGLCFWSYDKEGETHELALAESHFEHVDLEKELITLNPELRECL